MDMILYVLCVAFGAALGWFARVGLEHNQTTVAKVEKAATDLKS